MTLPPLFALCLSVVIVSFTGCGGGYSDPPSPPPTTPPPASETIDFAVSGTYSSPGIKPVNAVTADFNGDGDPDVAVSDRVSGTVAVYFNNGDGTLKDPILTTVPDSTGIAALAAGDFNEDGKPDLLVGVNFGMDRTFVMIGNGDGTFQQMPPFFNASFIRTITADINGDHHLDLAVGGNGFVRVWAGRGDGTFVDEGLQSFAGSYFGITVADFNGDSKLDIAAMDAGFNLGPTLYTYLGEGNDAFQEPTSATGFASVPSSLDHGDFDGDGKQDLVIGFPNIVLLYRGKGDGTFDLNLSHATSIYGTSDMDLTAGDSVLVTDVEGDGKVDAVTTDFKNGVLQIATNSAIGKVAPHDGIFSFPLSPGLVDPAAADLNGDGILDVVAANSQTGEITVVMSRKN